MIFYKSLLGSKYTLDFVNKLLSSRFLILIFENIPLGSAMILCISTFNFVFTIFYKYQNIKEIFQ